MELHLSAQDGSPRRARQAVTALLDGMGAAPLRNRAALLVSELVTNAVVHTGSECSLTAWYDQVEGLRVEVRDGDSHRARLLTGPDSDTGGRGLLLVDRLASRWGTDMLDTGKVVWFELRPDIGDGD
jgi:anti-sigma regulatory factor (Ser/Thr protein kinase)